MRLIFINENKYLFSKTFKLAVFSCFTGFSISPFSHLLWKVYIIQGPIGNNSEQESGPHCKYTASNMWHFTFNWEL